MQQIRRDWWLWLLAAGLGLALIVQAQTGPVSPLAASEISLVDPKTGIVRMQIDAVLPENGRPGIKWFDAQGNLVHATYLTKANELARGPVQKVPGWWDR